jgi:mitochondrial fission protein ELM1
MIWIISDDKIGMMTQSIGLAKAIGEAYEIKKIGLKFPWKQLTPYVRLPYPFCKSEDADELKAPWPKLIITCGRQAVLPALWVKQQSGNKTQIVKIQKPQISIRHFDLVITPRHDGFSGPKVFETLGALHGITKSVYNKEKDKWASELSKFSYPKFAILIGGNSKTHKMTPRIASQMIKNLRDLAVRKNASLFVTCSRRTPQICRDIIKAGLEGIPHHYYDGENGENPYIGYLAHADVIFATNDSVNMVSEAMSTGKPIYLLSLPGKSRRFSRFYKELLEQKIAREFKGEVDFWTYPPINETEKAASYIKKMLEDR